MIICISISFNECFIKDVMNLSVVHFLIFSSVSLFSGFGEAYKWMPVLGNQCILMKKYGALSSVIVLLV